MYMPEPAEQPSLHLLEYSVMYRCSNLACETCTLTGIRNKFYINLITTFNLIKIGLMQPLNKTIILNVFTR